MIGLELNVFWDTDETHNLYKAGIEYDIEEATLKPHTFYFISHIRPYQEKYCSVISDGITYIVNENYESVNRKINSQIMIGLSHNLLSKQN